jgi:hypothetical protein
MPVHSSACPSRDRPADDAFRNDVFPALRENAGKPRAARLAGDDRAPEIDSLMLSKNSIKEHRASVIQNKRTSVCTADRDCRKVGIDELQRILTQRPLSGALATGGNGRGQRHRNHILAVYRGGERTCQSMRNRFTTSDAPALSRRAFRVTFSPGAAIASSVCVINVPTGAAWLG